MQAKPRRLGRRQDALELKLERAPTSEARTVLGRLLQAARAVARLLALAAWTLVSIAIQAVAIVLPGRAKIVFARIYWAGMCRLLGLSVRVLDDRRPVTRAGRRRVIYVSNHSSWLDILALGGRIEACFVSKRDVERWPVIGIVARLGRTVFVSRDRRAAGREERDMSLRLRAGDDLILFPEGTSSDGSRVLPFHSTFFALAKPIVRPGSAPAPTETVPLIQPVSLVYDRLGGLPVGRNARTIFSWFGGMDLGPHVWRLAKWRGMRATILLHPPIDPADYASRKELARVTWVTVSEGADLLRQNRLVAQPAEGGTRAGLGRRPLVRRRRERPAYA